MQKIFKITWPIVIIALLTVMIFRKFIFQGLYPVPYNIMVGWYFPFNQGDWQGYIPGLPFKGGLFAADVFRQMIPWKKLSLELIRSGQVPLWNPYNMSGEPLLANIQTTIFYPFTILFFLLPAFDLAWGLYLFCAPLLAGIFMYLFFRSLNFQKIASLFAALGFAFNARFINWLEWGVVSHSGIWLPLSLFLIHLWLIKQKKWAPWLLLFSLYSTILGGYPQESFYSLLIVLLFFVFCLIKAKTKPSNGALMGFVVLVSIMVIPQAIPTANLFSLSAMKASSSNSFFRETRIDLAHLMTFFTPDFFGSRTKDNYWADTFTTVDYLDANFFVGTAVGFFALFSIIQAIQKKPKPFYWFFFLTFVFSLLMLTKNPLSYILSLIKIPLITTSAAVGIAYVTNFSLSALAAFGVEEWLDPNNKYPKTTPSTLFIFLLIPVSLFLIPNDYRSIAFKNSLIPLTIITVFSLSLALSQILNNLNYQIASALKKPIVFLFLFMTLFEYGFHANNTLSFSPPATAYPSHPLLAKLQSLSTNHYRTLGLWEAEIPTNLHTEYNIYSPEGYNPLHSQSYQEFSAKANTGRGQYKLERSDVDLSANDPFLRNRFLTLTSVQYIPAKVTDKSQDWEIEPLKFPPQDFELIWQETDYKIYQYLHPQSRISILGDYQVISDSHARLEKLFSPDFDPHTQIILEKEPIHRSHRQATGSAVITSYRPNMVNIDANVEKGPAFLLLTDSFYPSWQAEIDGLPTTIYRANHTFRAILVPQGKHEIEFFIRWP